MSLIQRAGGAGDVLHVQPQGVEEHGLAGGAAALLGGLGLVEGGDDIADVAEAFGRLAARSEVGGVGLAEGFGAAQHVVTAGFTVVHGGVLSQ